jgi:hypothetical protein
MMNDLRSSNGLLLKIL